MLTAKESKGLYALPPTPCKEGADGWDATDSVDLEESARMAENLVRDGIDGISLCGTTGECATLLWEEKKAFIDTAIQVAHKQAVKAIGADGAFVGLPIWQTPTLDNAVQFFAELSETLPDFPVKVYANARFFKFSFPTELWEGVAKKAPTVVATKISYGIDHLREDLAVAGSQVFPLKAGLPIRQGDSVLGGLGCAGGTGDQDLECSQTGLAAL